MLKKDLICDNCGWVASYLYEIESQEYHYCFNCNTQKKGPLIVVNFTNKKYSKSVTKGGTDDLMGPSA